MSSTVTHSKTETTKLKNKEESLREATASTSLENVLDKVKKIDNTCSFLKCKNRTSDFAIYCKYCNNHFCTTHGLPEVHGCGEAVRRDEKHKFLHPKPTLSKTEHEKATTKLSVKLKQMQFERKSKQGTSGKGRKK